MTAMATPATPHVPHTTAPSMAGVTYIKQPAPRVRHQQFTPGQAKRLGAQACKEGRGLMANPLTGNAARHWAIGWRTENRARNAQPASPKGSKG